VVSRVAAAAVALTFALAGRVVDRATLITLSALSRDTWSVRVSDALDLALNLGVWFLLIRKPLLLLLLLLLPLLMATQARFAESGDGS
jgi:hypothetical protein